MRDISFIVHVINSAIFLLCAFVVIPRSFYGRGGKLHYGRADRLLAQVYTVLIYIELLTGILLIILPTERDAANPQEALEQFTDRFWDTEHVLLMLFALFTIQLGMVYKSKYTGSRQKFHIQSVFFSIALFIVLVSLLATII